ncbi:MAG: TonB family protein [bacterium]
MLKRINTVTLFVIVLLAGCTNLFAQASLSAKPNAFRPATAPVESDRIRDGLVGPVRRVRTEIIKLSNSDGKLSEGKRSLLEVVSYDVKGTKVENQYFPVAGGTLTGKEMYKYDDKGNISEMTLLNDDGSLMGKEIYKYEFDFAGNWSKMTTSVAVIEAGKMSFEPTEVTYRSIMYYLDENMVRMAQPGAQPSVTNPASTLTESNSSPANAEPKPQPGNDAATSNSNQKLAATMPSTTNVGDKMKVTAEVRNTANSNTAARVVIDSEPPPSNPAPRPPLKPVSGGVLNGTALSLPPPLYPETAKRMRAFGSVLVEVVIDENGKVVSAQATSGPGTLRDAAVQAALKARFSPTTLSGMPVKVSGIISYKFSLAP